MKPRNLVIVRAVREQGLTHTEAAARFGVTRQWVHTLVCRYDQAGPDGLTPRSRAPKTRPGITPDTIRTRIIELRQQLSASGADAGPATIAWHLDREHLPTPSVSTIRRILHAAGLITPAPRKRPRSSYIRFEADLPNECWQADITHWYLATGARVEILDFLDDHSRKLLHITAATAFTGPMVVTVMNNLITDYGAPTSTLTDNGLVFTTRLARFKGAQGGFEKLLTSTASPRKTAARDILKPKARSNDSTRPSNASSASIPAQPRSRSYKPYSPSSRAGTTLPARIARSDGALRKRPTPPSPKPAPHKHLHRSGAPAPTESIVEERYQSATPVNSATWASAEPTPAPPRSCSSTAVRSSPATPALARSSPSTPSTQPRTTNPENDKTLSTMTRLTATASPSTQ